MRLERQFPESTATIRNSVLPAGGFCSAGASFNLTAQLLAQLIVTAYKFNYNGGRGGTSLYGTWHSAENNQH